VANACARVVDVATPHKPYTSNVHLSPHPIAVSSATVFYLRSVTPVVSKSRPQCDVFFCWACFLA